MDEAYEIEHRRQKEGFAQHRRRGQGRHEADGGRDLICVERRQSYFVDDEKRWLIQCKHNAHSGKSVGVNDIDDIVASCVQHSCTGYVLVCSTYPSSAAVNRLEGITAAPLPKIDATYWDAVKIEHLLSTPRNWTVAQRFFPKSANHAGWQIYGTERPNHWIVNFEGYYFHLTNRISSAFEHHLESIRERMKEIRAIDLPAGHMIRVRSVFYDDKHGSYTWYLDYLYPNIGRPFASSASIAHHLGHESVLSDGQYYNFEVIQRSYLKHSDHHDPDHYAYYVEDMHAFSHGRSRDRSLETRLEESRLSAQLKSEIEEESRRGYDKLVSSLNKIPFAKLQNSYNARIEDLTKFHLRHSWSEIIQSIELSSDRFFSAWFFFLAFDADRFFDFVSHLPQGWQKHFRLTRAYIFTPSDDQLSSINASDDDECQYELTVTIDPSLISDMTTGRSLLNDYFEELANAVDEYVCRTRTNESNEGRSQK